ncbi:DUF2177 family protein [Ideonella sp. YS5]|uniref:DUF2177 family protein n=1 Tax=Ideonella sp. YS5 TaxID=3453714 RepID=UPI003EE92132
MNTTDLTSPPSLDLRRFLRAWAGTALPFLALDAVWLSTMASRLYRPALGELMAESFDPLAALAFYLLYFTGVAWFVVLAPGRAPAIGAAAGRGALFGLVAYATYDLTNQATLRGWPWHVTLADLAWGAFATAAAAAIGRWWLTRAR